MAHGLMLDEPGNDPDCGHFDEFWRPDGDTCWDLIGSRPDQVFRCRRCGRVERFTERDPDRPGLAYRSPKADGSKVPGLWDMRDRQAVTA